MFPLGTHTKKESKPALRELRRWTLLTQEGTMRSAGQWRQRLLPKRSKLHKLLKSLLLFANKIIHKVHLTQNSKVLNKFTPKTYIQDMWTVCGQDQSDSEGQFKG